MSELNKELDEILEKFMADCSYGRGNPNSDKIIAKAHAAIQSLIVESRMAEVDYMKAGFNTAIAIGSKDVITVQEFREYLNARMHELREDKDG